MADMEEQDRRDYLFALLRTPPTENPMKTYQDIRTAVEKALTPQPDIEKLSNRGWLRQT